MMHTQVMRRAEYWTDHKMLRAKLKVVFSHYPKRKKSSPPKYLSMSYLSQESTSSDFDKKVADLLNRR